MQAASINTLNMKACLTADLQVPEAGIILHIGQVARETGQITQYRISAK
jgi:hypothetical protein